MRRTASVLLAGALALGAVATTDGEDLTDHPCYDTETAALAYPEQQVWFHEGDSKLGNVDAAAHPFDTEAPTASVQEGAGAGQYSGTAAYRGEVNTVEGTYDSVETVFAGTFTGCIDTLLLDMYSFDPVNRSSTAADARPNAHQFYLRVDIDGVTIFEQGPVESGTTYGNEAMGPNLSKAGIELGSLIEQFAEFGLLDDLAGEHTVEVAIAPWYVNTGHAVYVWDTTEVPSGMTFNGEITDEHRNND
jgi:hypothetical protein